VTRSFLSFADTGSASVFQRRQAQRRHRKPLPLAVQFLEPRLALAVGVEGDCAGASARPGDTTPPEIRSIAAPKGQTYGEGRTIAFRVNFNEPVVATGTPSLPITIGDTVRQAAWSGRGSGSRSLTFTLSVQSGDFAPAGVRVAGPIVLADGAAIRDRAGNDLNSEASGEYPDGIGSVRVDAVGPSVSDFGQVAIAGKRVSMRVTFTEPVIVRGKPSISFTLDGAPRQLVYARGSGSHVLVFTYRATRQETPTVENVAVATPVIALGRGRIIDAAGNRMAMGTRWDSLLSYSSWYVPQENLLAYMSSGTSFTTPPPIVLWDQTLWSLGAATGGRFTGSMQATFFVSPDVSFGSSMSIVGLATEFGQIRMRFTPTSGGSPVIGVGQFRQVNGMTAMQMQMISGQAGEAYTTHWAYMLPYDPGSFTPPDPRPDTDLTSTEWAWTPGTTWEYQSDQLFGPGGMGTFTITDYRNGYFWGSGSGPAGTLGESFTQLGSITPEGNVLFNVLTGQSTPTLLTLTGQITGRPLTAQMALRTYEFSGSDPAFGPLGFAVIVPDPST